MRSGRGARHGRDCGSWSVIGGRRAESPKGQFESGNWESGSRGEALRRLSGMSTLWFNWDMARSSLVAVRGSCMGHMRCHCARGPLHDVEPPGVTAAAGEGDAGVSRA